MYSYALRRGLEKELSKLSKKDPQQLFAIEKKIKEITTTQDANHYKNLRQPLQHLKRVHLGSFILVFSVDEKRKHIVFEAYEHHDKAYEPKKNIK